MEREEEQAINSEKAMKRSRDISPGGRTKKQQNEKTMLYALPRHFAQWFYGEGEKPVNGRKKQEAEIHASCKKTEEQWISRPAPDGIYSRTSGGRATSSCDSVRIAFRAAAAAAAVSALSAETDAANVAFWEICKARRDSEVE